MAAAKKASVAVIFAGLPDAYESEGYDRTHMKLPICQNALIEAVAKVQPNTVVVLHNGAPIEMPWVNSVKAILECYLGGEAVGTAQINLLFGKANPSGKLAETFPVRLEDTPCFTQFPGDGKKAIYGEGIFVGYRYYDKKKIDVLFPFGYGLSYTTFKYSGFSISKTNIKDTDTIDVSVTVTNTGKVAGKEIIELYVRDETNAAVRPEKELKNFVKVFLEPGESKTVTMTLDKRSFAWYNTEINDWYAATGNYEILVGSSSRDICQIGKIHLTSTMKLPFHVDQTTIFADILANPATREAAAPVIAQYMKRSGNGQNQSDAEKEAIDTIMENEMRAATPLRAMRNFFGTTREELDNLINSLNAALDK